MNIPNVNISSPSDWDELFNLDFDVTCKNHAAARTDAIICFDIEATSWYMNGGEVKTFDHTLYASDPDFYDYSNRLGVMYVWQCAIAVNGDIKVFMGRTWDEFRQFLDMLDAAIIDNYYYEGASVDFHPDKKNRRLNYTIWVHNLGYEFQYLQSIFNFGTNVDQKGSQFDDMVFARQARKPMRAIQYREKTRITWRDSYVLTQKSLANWCKDSNLPTKKLTVDPLTYYDEPRTPNTPLTDFEIQYSINDVISMCYGINQYLEKYGDLKSIPMTQTGEIRRICIEEVAIKNQDWAERCHNAMGQMDFDTYNMLVKAFCGGWTHANSMYTEKLMSDVKAFDFASDYPYHMCTRKYPVSCPTKVKDIKTALKELNSIDPNGYDITKKYYIHFSARNICSRYSNTFWSSSRCEALDGETLDNGKIYSASYGEFVMTDCDYHIFKQAYNFKKFKAIHIWECDADFLPKELIQVILDRYAYKTTLKGVEGEESRYVESKQFINSIYGVSVTKTIDDIVRFVSDDEGDKWIKQPLDMEQFNNSISQYQKEQKVYKDFLMYPIGTFVTAYARASLWKLIMSMDTRVIYGDTDSLKGVFNSDDLDFIEQYNKDVEEREEYVSTLLGIDADLFHPFDPKGRERRLGIFDREADCVEFKTLGAKRYVCSHQTPDGVKVEATIAGLPKQAALTMLPTVDSFNTGIVWDTMHSGKSMALYNDEQPAGVILTDRYGNQYVTSEDDLTGVCLQPTTFDLEMSDEYTMFLKFLLGEIDANISKLWLTPLED